MHPRRVAYLTLLAAVVAACNSSTDESETPERARGSAGSSSSDGTDTSGAPKAKVTGVYDVNPGAAWTTPSQRDDVMVEATRLVFPAKGNEALLQKKAGDVLVSDRQTNTNGNNRYGFIRKVNKVATEGDKIVVTTDEASLLDVVRGQFEIESPLGSFSTISDEGMADLPSQGLFLGPGYGTQGAKEIVFTKDFGKDLTDIKLFEKAKVTKAFTIKGQDAKLSFGGNLYIKELGFHVIPTVKLGADISTPGWTEVLDPKKWVKEFHLIFQGEVKSKLVVASEFDLTLELPPKGAADDAALAAEAVVSPEGKGSPFNKQLFKTEFAGPPLPTPLGPIPMTYEFALDAVCTPAVKGGLKAEVGFEANANATFGAQYEKDNGWKKISDWGYSINKIGPNVMVGGGFEVTCALTPSLTAKIAGLAGPNVYGEASGTFAASYEEKCEGGSKPNASVNVDVKAGVKFGVGAKLECLGFKLWETQIDLYEKQWQVLGPQSYPLSFALGRCGENGGSGGSSSGSGGSSSGTGGSSSGTGGSSSGTGGSSSGNGGSAQGGSGQGGEGGSGGGSSGPCGNGQIDGLEECDGSNFNGLTCVDYSFDNPNGTLKCNADCTVDTTGCAAGQSCDHDACTPGVALKADCDACTTKVCMANAYCCEVEWDALCVDIAKQNGCGCP